MRRTLFLVPLLLFATLAPAAPQITRIESNVGFSFAPTNVRIIGTDLADTPMSCVPSSGSDAGCPVEVFFGSKQAFVSAVSPTEVSVTAIPSSDELAVVDVRLVSQGKGEVTVPNGFTFAPLAQPGPENYTRYLLPLFVQNEQGAFGSVWSSEWTVYNSSSAPLQVIGGRPLTLADPPISYVPGESTARMAAAPMRQGAFVYVPNPLVNSTTMSLRIRDIAGGASSWGTEIPIVPMRKFGAITLIDIPNEPRYRATLRIYSEGDAPQTVRVRIFDPEVAEPLKVLDVVLDGLLYLVPNPFPSDPAYAQLDLLTNDIRALGKAIRVEIDNLGANVSPPPPQVWGFVSVTNNETQQVTTITPQDK